MQPIRADEIAEVSDFFSFGTNDLTQMTFGFSRDDVESRMMPPTSSRACSKRNPFETIDSRASANSCGWAPSGAGRPSRTSSSASAASTVAIPASIDLFYDAGLDYVSCSPFRVPIARLAAAQAIIAAGN